MSKNIKFLMLTNYVHKKLIEGEDCLRTGLYSWIPVHKGDVKYFQETPPEDYEKYEVIHVNIDGQDIFILG